MSDDLWYIRLQSRVLQEFRRSIDPFWNDQAAKDLNLRYLTPHEEEDQQMVANLGEQEQALGQATHYCGLAGTHAVEIERISAKLAENIQYSQEDLDTSHQFHEHFRQADTSAQALFPQIEQLIAQATSVCEGVPKS